MTMTIAPLSPGVASDRGAAGKQNEDAYTFFKIGPGEWRAEAGQSLYVLVVADGVTSKVGGAQASRIATETIERTFQLKAPALLAQLNGNSESVIAQFMSEVVHAANEEIRKVARRQPELGSMSTTLVLAVLAAGRLYVAHLGDSRAYLIRGRQIHRLTLDHNWVQDALDQQKMSLEEASIHPNRNVILRYLGIRDSIEVDHNIVVPGTYQEGLNRKYATSIPVEAGDLILLCSDGQTEKVPDQELLAIASSSPQQPQKAVDAMIQRALARREEDNITALLLT
ncbi:MAG: serine/threonine-protein phosphatase, partial [Caldilineaceae bacterium]|nr:serine/threonine-protein phosphatase [Caldilineaceae bacterium]